MLTRDAILSVLKRQGPSLPVQVKKALGEGDTFTIGAILTELKEAGKIKVSNTKRGGSPFYYAIEHGHRLVELINDLGEKDRRTANLLKERKLLRDDEEDPLTRVSLRQIKDFAIPVDVKTKEQGILFWKWYQLPNQEAERLVKERLGLLKQPEQEPFRVQDTKAAAPLAQEMPRPQEAQTLPSQGPAGPREERPVPSDREEGSAPQPVPAAKMLKESDDTGDEFLKQVLGYFAEKRIQVILKDVKRKHKDIEFEVSVPTAVGRVDYFCKAKNKQKSNDGDLSSAYLQGQGRKLPVIYITTGEVTKKAKERLNKEFKGLILVEL